MKVLFATNNELKVKEVKKIIEELNNKIEVYSLKDLNYEIEVVEDKPTLEENAYKKAYEVWVKEGKNYDYVIAEDFGFFSEYASEIMGVKSKRWFPGSDIDRAKALLNLFLDVKNRNAYYKSVYVALDKKGNVGVADGYLRGVIGEKMSSSIGFAYDSILIMEDGRYLSEYTLEEKNKISSRYKALSSLVKNL